MRTETETKPIVRKATYLGDPATTYEYRTVRRNPLSLRVIAFHWTDRDEWTLIVCEGDGQAKDAASRGGVGVFTEHVPMRPVGKDDIGRYVAEWITAR